MATVAMLANRDVVCRGLTRRSGRAHLPLELKRAVASTDVTDYSSRVPTVLPSAITILRHPVGGPRGVRLREHFLKFLLYVDGLLILVGRSRL